MVEWQAFPNLLHAPLSGGVGGDVRVRDAPGADLHDDEHIDSPERDGDRDQKVALPRSEKSRQAQFYESEQVVVWTHALEPSGFHCCATELVYEPVGTESRGFYALESGIRFRFRFTLTDMYRCAYSEVWHSSGMRGRPA